MYDQTRLWKKSSDILSNPMWGSCQSNVDGQQSTTTLFHFLILTRVAKSKRNDFGAETLKHAGG